MNIDSNSKYAILKRNTKMRLYQSSDIKIKNDGAAALESENYEISVHTGALIKIYQTEDHATSSKNLVAVQIIDYANHLPVYENLYECPKTNLQSVSESIWPFIISIVDPEHRLRMIKNTSHCKWLQNLKINDFVRVSGEMFNKPGTNYDCIIRFIGPIEELYCVGYFFCLEILNLENGCSPQAAKIPFSSKYLQNLDPRLVIFATANWISEIPKEQENQFSAFNLIGGTLEKVISVIGPSSFVAGNVVGSTSSLTSGKKSKKTKAPLSQFYDIEDNAQNFLNNNNSNNHNINNNDTSNKMERNKRGTLNILPQDFEEVKKHSTENRDKTIERRTTNTNTAQTQTQPQNGILKNKPKDQTKTSSTCREFVIINNEDIDKSICHESDVVVIENPSPSDVDLTELLGNHWPSTAGDAGLMLNGQKPANKAASNPNKTNQNKSSVAGNNTKKRNEMSKNSNTRKFQDATHESQEISPTVLENEYMPITSLQEVPNTNLGLGSMVEVRVPDSTDQLYGVIRWIGTPPDQNNLLIGVELDDDYIDKNFITTDGGLNGIRLFKCPAGRGIFITSDICSFDRRFLGAEGGAVSSGSCGNNDLKMKTTNGFHDDDQQTFGHMECPVVTGTLAPLKCPSLNILEGLCGKFKGIQGHHNSCYLDVTLFSMFAFTPVFDSILYRPPEKDDISHYCEIQRVLREEIVNPLRHQLFVRADRVMKLRELLDKLSSVSGLCSEEKDPEEFLNCLLSQIMRAEPFLKLNSGQDAYYYQLFVDKDERLSFPGVQQLFEQSFYSSDIKLKEVPSCLIIQMPRFGKSFKMYPRILPSQVLDVTDIIEDSPRQCTVCGKLAEFECRDCFGSLQNGVGLESTAFCPKCIETVHLHAKRMRHSYRKLSVPQDFRVMAEQMTVPRLYMELFAVVCIETSHYVTFVKAGSGPDAPWCFFDSMADRKGEKNGYNIPEMITVPDLPQWLSEDGARTVNETSSNDKMLPEHAKRLFCDAYMCMYQSTDVMMYR